MTKGTQANIIMLLKNPFSIFFLFIIVNVINNIVKEKIDIRNNSITKCFTPTPSSSPNEKNAIASRRYNIIWAANLMSCLFSLLSLMSIEYKIRNSF